MSAISLKSITGITSITTPAGVDNQLTLHTNNTTEAVKLDIAGNLHFHNHLAIAGVTTASDDINIPVTNKKLKIGASGQLQLYNQGYHSRIDHVGNHWLSIRSNALGLFDASDNYFLDGLASTGAVRLYFSNSIKLATTSTGISVTGGAVFTSTDAGSSAAPELKLHRNSASPADADYLGQIKFAGESDTGVERNYAKITGKILDASNGTEDGILEFAHIKAGSQTITGRWRSDSLQLLNSTNLTVDGDIDVDGHTNLDNVSIAGVTTFASNVDIDGNTTFGANGSITSSADFHLSSNSLRVTGGSTVVGEFKGASIPTVQVTQTTNNTDLQLRANSEGGLVRTATNYPLILGANQREKLRIAGGAYATIGINTSTFDNAGAQLKIEGRGTGTTSPAYLQIKGVGPGVLHSYVDLIATSDSNAGNAYRGLGVLMHDEPTNVEWFSGRPYAGSDKFIIGRKASPSYRTQSGEVANQLFAITSNGDVRIGSGTASTFGSGTTVLSTYNASTYTANLVTSGTHILQMIASQTHGTTSIGTRSNHRLNLCTNDNTKVTIDTVGRMGINATPSVNHEYLHMKPVGNNVLDLRYELNSDTDIRHKFYDNTGTQRATFGYTTYANNSTYPNFHDSLYIQTDPGSNGSLSTVMWINRDGQFIKPFTYKFIVESNGTSVGGGWNKLLGLSIDTGQSTGISNGTYWSNSNQRFTAPVSGTYNFFFGGWGNYSTSTGDRYAVCFRINGGAFKYISGGAYSLVDSPLNGYSISQNLTVNDYVELWYYSAGSNTWGGGHRVFWGGYFLG